MNDQDIKLGLYIEAAHKERAIKKSQGGCCLNKLVGEKKCKQMGIRRAHCFFLRFR